nr:MAG TPA: helix-turn-helix domain protein [Caudoviricetes sp.]
MRIYEYHGKSNISGEKIKSARLKRELTQNQLVARLEVEGVDITQATLSRIESGERFVADFELALIAKILNVDINELIDLY